MNKLLLLDTETTGKGPQDRLLQVAYCEVILSEEGFSMGEIKQAKFKPPVPISFEAMAVHQITPEDLADAVPFEASATRTELLNLANTHVLVAHNAPFDLVMLEREGVNFRRFIDTLRVARHLVESPNHQLQFLKYSLGIYRDMAATTPNLTFTAHDAAGDVATLFFLFKHLLTNQKNAAPETINEFVKLSTEPVAIKKFTFGKHNGKSFEDVKRIDPGYITWLLNSERQKLNDRNDDLVYSLQLLG